MSFGPGALNASAVYLGSTPATAVYLGTEKVWPNFVGQLSPWYSPTDAAGTFIDVPWPDGAEFCDAIGISGGAGGEGTGVGGNAQKGGGAGAWGGVTFTRTQGGVTHDKIQVTRNYQTNPDYGAGGGAIGTAGTAGSQIIICPKRGLAVTASLQFIVQGGARMSSNNATLRNGGNVAATFVFNGRTYTLASYGANAGQGGNSTSKNGSAGTRPGGGGQGGDNGGLTGNPGGAGVHGAAILYWY